MTEVRVRAARPGDRSAALRLASRLAEGVAAWRDAAAVERVVTGWVDARFAHLDGDEAAVFVAEDEGKVVGFAAVEVRPHWAGDRDAYLGELVVDRNAEGRGVGRAMVEAVSGWADNEGLAHLTLDTGAANARARRFYGSLGFAEEDIRLTLQLTPRDGP